MTLKGINLAVMLLFCSNVLDILANKANISQNFLLTIYNFFYFHVM